MNNRLEFESNHLYRMAVNYSEWEREMHTEKEQVSKAKHLQDIENFVSVIKDVREKCKTLSPGPETTLNDCSRYIIKKGLET